MGQRFRTSDTGAFARALCEWHGTGDWRMLLVQRRRIADVAYEDVVRAARRYLQPNNRTSGILLADSASEPITVARQGLDSAALEHMDQLAAIAPGERIDRSLANLGLRTVRHELSNGAHLALLEQQTRGDRVNVVLIFDSPADGAALREAAQLIPDVLWQGADGLDRTELEDRLVALQTELSFDASPGRLEVRVTSFREHVCAALELLGRVLLGASASDEHLRRLKRPRLVDLERAQHEVDRVAWFEIERALASGRDVPSLVEQYQALEGVSIDVLNAALGEMQRGSLSMAAVGDFDSGLMIEAMERAFRGCHFRDIDTHGRFGGERSEQKPKERAVRGVPGAESSVVVSGFVLPLAEDHPDYQALSFANFMLGGHSGSPFQRRMELEGIAYYAMSVIYPLWQVTGSWMAATCSPGSEADSLTVMEEVRQDFLEAPPAMAEVVEAKRIYFEGQLSYRASDGLLAQLIAREGAAGRTLRALEAAERRIQELTPEETHAAALRWWDEDVGFLILAGSPEAMRTIQALER